MMAHTPNHHTGSGKGVGAGVLLQLDLHLSDGTVHTTVTDASWVAFDANAYLHPKPGRNWYEHVLEYVIASPLFLSALLKMKKEAGFLSLSSLSLR